MSAYQGLPTMKKDLWCSSCIMKLAKVANCLSSRGYPEDGLSRCDGGCFTCSLGSHSIDADGPWVSPCLFCGTCLTGTRLLHVTAGRQVTAFWLKRIITILLVCKWHCCTVILWIVGVLVLKAGEASVMLLGCCIFYFYWLI